jgi:phage shock protein PspC (stress-responsive transcriptional regulator)
VGELDPTRWYRDRPERRIAGVAAAVAEGVGVAVSAVRVGFIVLAFFHLLGPVLYGALWLVVPFTPGEPSPLEQVLARGQEIIRRWRNGNGTLPVDRGA